MAQHARPALNSIMLHHCVQAGLDMAIINPAHVTPYADIPAEEKELSEDLIFNRRADALDRSRGDQPIDARSDAAQERPDGRSQALREAEGHGVGVRRPDVRADPRGRARHERDLPVEAKELEDHRAQAQAGD